MGKTLMKADFVASTYTDAQRRATQKYRTENKEKVNEQRKLQVHRIKVQVILFLLTDHQHSIRYV